MPSIGAPEIVIILVLALLVFGPKRLPEIGRSFGRTVREFKKASDTARREFGVDEIERELKGVKSEVAGVGQALSEVKADLKVDVDTGTTRPRAAAGAAAAATGVTGAGAAAGGTKEAGAAAAGTAGPEGDASGTTIQEREMVDVAARADAPFDVARAGADDAAPKSAPDDAGRARRDEG